MTTEKIALITDSTCDLPLEFLREHNIHVLPLKIVYKDRVYTDRVDIQPEDVYSNMHLETPTTSMPSPGEAGRLLADLREQGYTSVLAIHLSSGLSGTCNMMEMVAKQFESLRIKVIDSKALSMALGFMVCEAAHQISKKVSFDELVSRVTSLRQKINVFYVIKSLEYLQRGGRIGRVQAAIGGMLDIKPIISINSEGRYYSVTKVRGRKNSLNKLLEITRDLISGKKLKIAVMHGNALEEAQMLMQKINQLPNVSLEEVFFGQIGPGMVVHTGPGLVGIACHEV